LRSDYQAFFQQPVAEDLRHAALKKLFADPHFNQMDMLDVYVDDYTQFEPLPVALKVRLPSAREFLSDSERSELEAVEARTGATGGAVEASADPATECDAVADGETGGEARAQAADDASVGSTSGPAATTTESPAASDVPDRPLNASSSAAPVATLTPPDSSSS
jgi:hypothetical protein